MVISIGRSKNLLDVFTLERVSKDARHANVEVTNGILFQNDLVFESKFVLDP